MVYTVAYYYGWINVKWTEYPGSKNIPGSCLQSTRVQVPEYSFYHFYITYIHTHTYTHTPPSHTHTHTRSLTHTCHLLKLSFGTNWVDHFLIGYKHRWPYFLISWIISYLFLLPTLNSGYQRVSG